MTSGFSRVQVRKLTDSVAGNYTPLFGVTPGTAAANKALVLDGSGAIGTITTLTATTINATTINAGTIGTTGINATQTYRTSSQVNATTTTLADITGLVATVVAGTYTFRAVLYTTCGGTGGVKLAFNYTNSAALSAINAIGYGYTASATATSSTTTTTTQTSIVASNTAFTSVILEGTMVVSTGGTVTLQFAENSANSTSSILVGSTLELTRIA